MRTNPSPDGRYNLEIHSFEMRMSHWVDAPLVLESASRKPVLDLRDSLWSVVEDEWKGPATLRLSLRHYPGDGGTAKVLMDFEQGLAAIETDWTFVELPFNEISSWLERNTSMI